MHNKWSRYACLLISDCGPGNHQGCQIHFLKRRHDEDESRGVFETGSGSSGKGKQGKRKRGDAAASEDGQDLGDDVTKVDSDVCSTAEEGREEKKKKKKKVIKEREKEKEEKKERKKSKRG